MKRLSLALNSILLLAMFSVNALAGVIITPTGVTSSTSADDLWSANNLINGSGLSGDGLSATHAAAADTNSWVTNDPAGSNGAYFDQGPDPVLTFDLGGTYLMNNLHVWQYALDNDNQARTATLEFSSTGTGGVFSGAIQVSLNKSTSPVPVQSFSFGPVSANAARLTITGNYDGDSGDGGDRVGLSEIKFGSVPEPTSLVMFALVSLVGVRRRRAA